MMAIEFKSSHFARDVILWGLRSYVAYPLSYRQIQKMMQERGVEVDHAILRCSGLKYVPLLEKVYLARKRLVGGSSRLGATYVRIKGHGTICIARSTRRVPIHKGQLPSTGKLRPAYQFYSLAA